MHLWLAGLGNHTHPLTRHSIGQLLLLNLFDRVASSPGTSLESPFPLHRAPVKAHARTSTLSFSLTASTPKPDSPRIRMTFLHPMLLMNANGLAIRSHLNHSNELKKLIVLHDDIDLKPGVVKPQFGGSLRGHNGLRSIEKAFGGGGSTKAARDFARIRVGVGRGESGDAVVDHVLGPLSRDEVESCSFDRDTGETGKKLERVWRVLAEEVIPKLEQRS